MTPHGQGEEGVVSGSVSVSVSFRFVSFRLGAKRHKHRHSAWSGGGRGGGFVLFCLVSFAEGAVVELRVSPLTGIEKAVIILKSGKWPKSY